MRPTMTQTPVSHESAPKEPQNRPTEPGSIPLWQGVLWMIAIAGTWTIILVLFHNLMNRLLG
jgi:hypothetical protein